MMDRKKVTSRRMSFLATLISLLFLTLSVHAQLHIDAVYPTLAEFGQSLEISIVGSGFDEQTRITMYPDVGNRRAIIGSVDDDTGTYDVTVVGDKTYVMSYDGLSIIDTSDSEHPRVVAEVVTRDTGDIEFPLNPQAVAVVGDMAYVAASGWEVSRLQVIDVSNPLHPRIIGSVDVDFAEDVSIDGDKAYVADGFSGLQVIDIQNPRYPRIIGRVSTPDWATAVTVDGDKAYVADHSGLQVIDVSHPEEPEITSSVNTPYDAQAVAVVGDKAYVVDSNLLNNTLHVIDIGDSESPRIVGSFDKLGHAHDIAVSGDRAYVSDGESGLQVIEVSDPEMPQRIGMVATAGSANAVAVVRGKAYVSNEQGGLQVIDVGHLTNPQVLDSVNGIEEAYDIAVDGDEAYVADGHNGLQVIDISAPDAPQIIGSVYLRGSAWRVAVSGDRALVGRGRNLLIIDIYNPQNPKIMGSIDTPDSIESITVAGEIAYVAAYDSGLLIIDISNPEHPRIIGSAATPGIAEDVTVVGSMAYVAAYDSGLLVIDVSNPGAPRILGAVDTPSFARSVEVADGIAYVADYRYGLQVIDVSNPQAPQVIGMAETPGYHMAVTVSDARAYVSARHINSGLLVFDVSMPETPMPLGLLNTPAGAWNFSIVNNMAYVDTFSGLVVVPLLTELRPISVNRDTSISVELPSPLMAGHFTLRVFNSDEYEELPGAISFTSDSSLLNAKAIVVAGGGSDVSGHDIWEETKLCANKAYDALVLHGYTHDSIRYITPELNNPYADSLSLDDLSSDLEEAITIWARDATQLLLYFVGHGADEHFVLHQNGPEIQIVNVQELDGWLDNLQQSMPGPLRLVYDACQSGSFIPKLRPPDGKERLIITSASHEPAYFLGGGEISFSFRFWERSLQNRGNIGDAFSHAREYMRSYQSALMEANWDFAHYHNESEEIALAAGMSVQRGVSHYIRKQPYICDVSDPQVLADGSNAASIRASGVIDSDRVTATIIPPDVSPEDSDIPVTDLPILPLIDPDGDGVYEAVYDGFEQTGTYGVVIKSQATYDTYSYVSGSMTTQTIYSPAMHTSVTNTEGLTNRIQPDAYEEDDDPGQASTITLNAAAPQSHNFHSDQDEDWVKFYAIAGETYKIKAANPSVFCDAVIEVFATDEETSLAGPIDEGADGGEESLDWTCGADGVYFVKMSSANENFGEQVKYDLKVYQPVGVLLTLVSGTITDADNGAPIGNARIVSTANTSAISDTRTSVGSYWMPHEPGSYTFTINAAGYPPMVFREVVIPEAPSMTRNFALEHDPIPPPPPTPKAGSGSGGGGGCFVDAAKRTETGPNKTITPAYGK